MKTSELEILDAAIRALGSLEEAIDWLLRPAIGLNQKRPIDVMKTADGLEQVIDYLIRIEYGVYT